MKNNIELRTFLEKYININSWRLDIARSTVSTTWEGSLIKYLSNNLWESFWCVYQWSFAYDTIIKPDPNSDGWKYDVDVAIRLNYRDDWDWEEYKYHGLLLDCLKESDRYKDKIDTSKERAIRVQYDANDWEFFVDLVPMFEYGENWYVINKSSNVIEISGWTLFSNWVNEQNNKTSVEWSQKKFLKEIIRIYKYLRNQADPDLIRSVQLTLLLARQVDKIEEAWFLNLSTTLHRITSELKKELEWIESISDLDLSNPMLPDEVFDRNFTDDQFKEFKSWVIDLSGKIEDAYSEEDEDKSIEKWTTIFGEKFSSKKDIAKSLLPMVYSHAQDPLFYGLRRSDNVQKIQIIWTKMTSRFSRSPHPFDSNTPIDISRWDVSLRFTAKRHPFIQGQLYWQVTNEDNKYVKDKRWDIDDSRKMSYTYKWPYIEETASWQWKHWVKCFMVNSQNEIIWESDLFYVNIY